MPDGFRGDAAETLLTAANEALLEARTKHDKYPFSPGSESVVPIPASPYYEGSDKYSMKTSGDHD